MNLISNHSESHFSISLTAFRNMLQIILDSTVFLCIIYSFILTLSAKWRCASKCHSESESVLNAVSITNISASWERRTWIRKCIIHKVLLQNEMTEVWLPAVYAGFDLWFMNMIYRLWMRPRHVLASVSRASMIHSLSAVTSATYPCRNV